MYEQQLIISLNDALSIKIGNALSWEEIQLVVKEKVNQLLQNDFHGLITLLYRLDVSEEKLKSLLETNQDQDAAGIISQLIVERQLQKIKSRDELRNNDHISEEEKW